MRSFSSASARWTVGVVALVMVTGRSVNADLLVDLDASVPDSLVDENGVITWLDQSGNDLHAVDDVQGGGISFPSATPFPSGLEGVDFDATFSRQRMQLLSPVDAGILFDQSSPDAEGFSIFVVAQGEQPSPGGWNDIIGNSSVVSDGFLLRWNTDNGIFHASLDSGNVNGTSQNNSAGQDNYNGGDPFVIAVNYDPVAGGGELTLASTLNNYTQVFFVPPLNFSAGGNALWLGSSTAGARYFDGKIGEVLIYDAALTPEQFTSQIEDLREKWVPSGMVCDLLEIACTVATSDAGLATVQATLSAGLDGGGDCECTTVDVLIDDVPSGSMTVADGAIEVPIPEGCAGEGHVLQVVCHNSAGAEGASGTCTFSCPEFVPPCDTVELACAVVTGDGPQDADDPFLHLDASIPDSLIDENGIITWFDESGNDRHAIDAGAGGGITYPSAAPFPSGLDGVEFDATAGRQRMRLLDPTDAQLLFDQSSPDAEGFCIFVVAQGDGPSPGEWNDIIGNSTVISDGFLMRWNTQSGTFHASLDDGSGVPTLQGGAPNNYNSGEPFVIAINYDPLAAGGEATLASTLNRYRRVFAVPPLNFTSGGNALWLGSTTSATRYFDGKIGEVLIYDRALTSADFESKLAELGEKWIDIAEEVTVRATVSAELDGGGDCDCTVVDVFTDDVLAAASMPVDADGTIEVPLLGGCDGDDDHVLEVVCRSSFGDEGGRGTCTFSCAGEGARFIRGDVDVDGRLAITDPVKIFNFLFAGNAEVTCMDAADASDQGSVNLASGVYILSYLFASSAEPPAPFPDCGQDTTEDAGGVDLGCESFAACQ